MTPTYEEARLWLADERAERFWQMIEKQPDGCWLWTGALTNSGHGQYRMYDGPVRVHRLMWILARQQDIPDWLVVRHFMCDTKRCCNPAHLVGGTQGENVRDTWLIHKAYRDDIENRARAEYLKHPYVGYFHEHSSKNVIPPPAVGEQSVGYTMHPPSFATA
jgi:hypothetical protein